MSDFSKNQYHSLGDLGFPDADEFLRGDHPTRLSLEDLKKLGDQALPLGERTENIPEKPSIGSSVNFKHPQKGFKRISTPSDVFRVVSIRFGEKGIYYVLSYEKNSKKLVRAKRDDLIFD